MTDALGIGQLVLGVLQQVPEPHVAMAEIGKIVVVQRPERAVIMRSD